MRKYMISKLWNSIDICKQIYAFTEQYFQPFAFIAISFEEEFQSTFRDKYWTGSSMQTDYWIIEIIVSHWKYCLL